MSLHSIALANMRIAPIQITSPGHSVSTWGADIDYFISGADVEVAPRIRNNTIPSGWCCCPAAA